LALNPKRQHGETNVTITITVDGDEISIEDFSDVQRYFSIILEEIDKESFRSDKRSVKWNISSVSNGSVNLTFSGVPISPNVDLKSVSDLVENIQSGISVLAEKAQRPRFFSDRALKQLESLANKLNHGMQVLKLGSETHVVSITKDIARNVDEIIGPRFESYGSIEGCLDGANIHKDPYFHVYTSLNDRLIRCNVDKGMTQRMLDCLGQRVYVYGLIQSRNDGERVSILVQEIETLPSENELPTIQEMIGILAEDHD